MLKNLFKNNKNNEVRKLNENDIKGLTYCIDNKIRVKLTKVNDRQTMIELFNGRVCNFNKINPQDINNKQQAQLVMDCVNSFQKGNYVKRNKRIEIER